MANKVTNHFEQVLKEYLDDLASKDEAFAVKYKAEKKSLKDCMQYILNKVQKSGSNGFHQDEIYGMAVHYYDEEKIDIGKPVSARVVVNKSIELSEEDKKEALEIARRKAIEELASNTENVELSEEDKAAVTEVAKQNAFNEAIAKKKDALTKKATKKAALPTTDMPTLFD